MGVLIQVRDVPPEVHRVLKARAAEAGVSLSELIRDELARVAQRPTRAELLRRIAARPAVDLGRSTAVEVLHDVRDAHGW